MNFVVPNWAFCIFAVFVAACGVTSGVLLASFHAFDGIGLLNLISAVLALLALIVFAEAFTDIPLWKSFGLSILAPGLVWTLTLLPLGCAFGAAISHFANQPSSDVVLRSSIGFFIYSIPILALIDEQVTLPRTFKPRSQDFRWKMFGFYLGAGSLVIQVITSVASLQFEQ